MPVGAGGRVRLPVGLAAWESLTRMAVIDGLDSVSVGAFLEKLTSRTPEPREGFQPLPTPQAQPGSGDVWFVPARWLVVALAILGQLLSRGRISKLGVAGLVWSVTPRSLRIAAAGFAAAATIVLVGAAAAITLLVFQLT